MSDWARHELGAAQLGDRRRVERLVRVTEFVAEHLGESVPDACKVWADAEGAYRLWANGKVKPEAIYDAHFRCTAERARHEERVLVFQDGSSADQTSHKATKGLGYLENRCTRGFMHHPSLVVSTSGNIVGLADMQVWARPLEELGKSKERHSLPIVEKESYAWLLAWESVQKRLPDSVKLIGVADQEADIYELFAAPRRAGADLLIRATDDRGVKHPARLLRKSAREQPVAAYFNVEVPRRPELPSRTARLSLRFAPLTLLNTKHAHIAFLEVPVWVVLVEEEAPPAGVKPLNWLLLTTLKVSSTEHALEVFDQAG